LKDKYADNSHMLSRDVLMDLLVFFERPQTDADKNLHLVVDGDMDTPHGSHDLHVCNDCQL